MTTEETLDQAYFEWLVDQVHAVHGSQVYRELFWQMYKKEYIWIVPNDDNRIQDGLDLLAEFFRERGIESEAIRTGAGCSCLEMLIGLSRRVAFIAGGSSIGWAWQLVGNLGFHSMSDPLTGINIQTIDEFLDRVIWRTYHADGAGGFFPLAFAEQDQRKVELWYQMSKYIEENPSELYPM